MASPRRPQRLVGEADALRAVGEGARRHRRATFSGNKVPGGRWSC